MSFHSDVNVALDVIRKEHNADFLVYAGAINRRGAEKVVSELAEATAKHKNLILLLCTTGGDSHAAFKIARACQATYDTVMPSERYKTTDHPRLTVFVPTLCKSAGTIIALGADDLMMSSDAELGPIDIQMRRPEEVGELTSTLTPVQAIQSLQRQMTTVFVDMFSALRFDEKMAFSTKMAGEIARDMAGSLIGPIAGQIDPFRLAETERLLKISSEYGERLNEGVENLRDGALSRLLSAYPSHGFVIDRGEANTLFRRVYKPSAAVKKLGDIISFVYRSPEAETAFVRLIEPLHDPEKKEEDDEKKPDASRAEEDNGRRVGDDGEGGSEVRRTDQAKKSRRKEG
jgi:hypothetical protein